MDFVITEELANKILTYLGTRPYAEVMELVPHLQQIKPIIKEATMEEESIAPAPQETPTESVAPEIDAQLEPAEETGEETEEAPETEQEFNTSEEPSEAGAPEEAETEVL